MRMLFRKFHGVTTQTLKMYILIPLALVVVIITILESLVILESVTQIVRLRVVEAQIMSNEQVLYGIDQYFGELARIARQPGSSMEILPILRKYPEDVTASALLSDQYTAQMFMFREIMLPNSDFESALIYHERQDKFYALSDSYLIQQNRQYDFSVPRADYQTKLPKSVAGAGATWISGIRPSAMLIKPSSDFVVTYIQEIMIPASIRPSPLGAFFLNIDIGAFERLYDRYSADPDSDYYIIDRDGNIVACTNKARLANPVNEYVHRIDFSEPEAHSLISDGKVYTISQVSEVCGWRVIKEAAEKVVFGYEREILRIILLSTVLLLMLEFVAIWAMVSRFTRPITLIKARLMEVAAGDMNVRFDVDDQHPVAEVRDMNMMLQEMLDKINQLIRRIYEEESEKRELEMSVLQSQITPHFIYNTLSRIQWMATMQQADNVASLLGAFSGILTYCSRNTDYYVTLRDEVCFIQEYIKIMQLRLLGEVDAELRIAPELMDMRVLRLILQPIVENAFLYAFVDDGSKPLKLLVSGEARENRLLLRVKDNGKGIRPEVLRTLLEERTPHTKDSIALNNIQRRVHAHFGKDFGLSVESVIGMGTTVTIILPLERMVR